MRESRCLRCKLWRSDKGAQLGMNATGKGGSPAIRRRDVGEPMKRHQIIAEPTKDRISKLSEFLCGALERQTPRTQPQGSDGTYRPVTAVSAFAVRSRTITT